MTICVKDRHELLGDVIECDDLGAPYVHLSEYGHTVDKHINIINSLRKGAFVDKYIIMPNHIHLIIFIENDMRDCKNGAMRTSRPTTIPNLLRSFKAMISKEIGFSIWQTSYHDHIIRNEAEYHKLWQYIDENPTNWLDDRYFGGVDNGAVPHND